MRRWVSFNGIALPSFSVSLGFWKGVCVHAAALWDSDDVPALG